MAKQTKKVNKVREVGKKVQQIRTVGQKGQQNCPTSLKRSIFS